MRANAVSASARTIDTHEEHDDDREEHPVGAGHRGVSSARAASRVRLRLELAERVEQLALATLHRAWRRARRRGRSSSRCSDAVHDEQRELVVERSTRARAPGARATDGQITTSPSTIGGSSASIGEPGPRPPSSGRRPLGTLVVVDREREHVGRAGAVEEALVEIGDRRSRRRRSATARRRAARAPRRATSRARRIQRAEVDRRPPTARRSRRRSTRSSRRPRRALASSRSASLRS